VVHDTCLTIVSHVAMEIVSLDERSQIDAVTKKSRVCISVVAYFRVGAQIIEACIENGTDYVDT
jgi:saccharopine dehydrogenase-like NADP-dependent oxidoreductase